MTRGHERQICRFALAAPALIGQSVRVTDDDRIRRKERFNAAVRRYSSIGVARGDIAVVLGKIVDACEACESDDDLSTIAVIVIDPFLDLRGKAAWDAFEAAMRTSQPLRKAYTGADIHIPDDVIRRLDALVHVDESLDGSDPDRFRHD